MTAKKADEFEYADAWNDGQEAVSDNLPDGNYQATLTQCRIDRRDDGSEYWFLLFEHEGKTVPKFNNFDSEIGAKISGQDAKALGYHGPKDGLADWCATEAAIGLICDIKVKTKPGETRDYQNVYLNRVHGQTSERAAVANDDDIPF